MPTAGFPGGDKNAVSDAGLKRLGSYAFDGRVHAADVFSVEKAVNIVGAFVRDQMPERLDVFVGLPFSERDDFDISEFVIVVEAEGQGQT